MALLTVLRWYLIIVLICISLIIATHAKSWLIGRYSDAGRDWGQEEKGMTEDEMAGWHHWLNEHESEWTPGVGDGQGGLACCDSWGRKEPDTTEQLNWTEPPGKPNTMHNLVNLGYLSMRGDYFYITKWAPSKENPCQTPWRQRENHLPRMSLLQTNIDVTV